LDLAALNTQSRKPGAGIHLSAEYGRAGAIGGPAHELGASPQNHSGGAGAGGQTSLLYDFVENDVESEVGGELGGKRSTAVFFELGKEFGEVG
jgi:hypothetical protein